MAQETISFDDFLKEIDEKPIKAGFRKGNGKKVTDANDIEDAPIKNNGGKTRSNLLKQKGNEEEKYQLAANGIMALNRSANNTLNAYINRAPQYKTIKQQMVVLKEALIAYKKNGETSMADECRQNIIALSETKKKFEKIVKSKTKEEKEDQTEKIRNSPELKELKLNKEVLKEEYANLNPNTLYSRIIKIREKLRFKDSVTGDDDIIDLDDEELNDEELDTIINKDLSSSKLLSDYHALCSHISDLTGILPKEIEMMNSSDIRKAIKENMSSEDQERLEEIKGNLELNKMEASSEMKRLKGYNDVTDIMFDIFDFSVEENAPKEMLAASNVGYVQAIAYNTCSKMNMLHHLPDSICYGLLGLSVAINKWYKIQKMKDHALSFEGFAHMYVVNSIQRGLYELTSGGMISGSARATMEHYRKQNHKFWVENNSELKDLPTDIIEDLLASSGEQGLGEVMTESGYKTMVGGEGSDDADIWANAVAGSSTGDDSMAESKMEYETLIKSLKGLFNLFETKIDNKTGIKQITDRKIFDKYDYKLFLMSFGLMTHYNPETGKNEPYSQKEIAEQLALMYRADGVKKTFSQPAIAARRKTILDKISMIMTQNPEIKKGFEYLTYYFMANSENMNFLSNSREELGIKYDLEEEAKNENSKFAEARRNGKKQVFQVSDSNMLDEQLAKGFRDLKSI